MEYFLQVGDKRLPAINQENEVWVRFEDVKFILEEYNTILYNQQRSPTDWNLSINEP